MADLDQMKTDLLARIDAAAAPDAIEAIRVETLGKQGSVTALLKTLGGMSPEERQVEGPRINGLREAVAGAIATRKAMVEAAALDARLAGERLDMTLPVDAPLGGTIHPVSQVMDELAEIFADLGFAVATGPEIEDDWHNFTALNIPASHPARAMHDTFYMADNHVGDGNRDSASAAGGERGSPSDGGFAAGEPRKMLLRTHTSPVQIRTMLQQKPPIRIIAPGRTYRSDSDATHTPMFHQVEGLVIDKGITLGHLKWTLETFLKAFFERDDIVLRLRPSYFPFTEPSAEVDVGYTLEKGKRVIGGSGGGWMEVLGSGMVHPKVIAACGLDPDEWQGFAFGCGIDRLAMLKYGMDDLRAFFDGDIRWLKHYGFSGLDVPTLSGGVGA
ncbi:MULTISPECIES: phenylalanine--tRNA ligase subunit alpha [unclassified Sphingomonas]|uniref:phenylalanine--tRNA ligase subunit alpha n=1 Tax=unclassified Sphingomonas TaxID=196159 RepID=UPI0009293F8E|nr:MULTISPECIES: phenylalanine--tRNA ligase subunit alpha [unclassified Sphingomonas]MBN8848714.1 phenylalanine--tRNA ligase subunit alpha [Sphingomonas sp.]OJV33420.1 MAG: phenylalanine--tRNA ligase subunit alpha [Sphingomonas sp. 67-36]